MSFYKALLLSVLVLSVKGSSDTTEDKDEKIQQVTRLLTLENMISTTVTTLSFTDVVYPTCTATVPGIVHCANHKDIKPSAAHEIPTLTHTPEDINPEESREGISHSYQLAEVVMPSCDCIETARSRMPRLFLSHNFITIKSTTTLTTSTTIVSTDRSTTVSITYNGCVPSDAPTTSVCGA